MLKRSFIKAMAGSLLAAAVAPAALAGKSAKAGYAESNGLKSYHEITGAGEPLLLLHGGLGSLDMFGALRPALAKNR